MTPAAITAAADWLSDREDPLGTPEAFREWLMSLPAGAPVGLTRNCAACPLALFLRHSGWPKAEVDYLTYSPAPGWDPRPLPAWALEFIRDVDHLDRLHKTSVLVTAGQALELLGPDEEDARLKKRGLT